MSIFEYPESPRAPWRTGDGSQDALQGYAYSPAKTSERDRLNAFRNDPALRAKFPQWNAKMAGKPVRFIASGSTSGRTSTSSRTGKDIDVIDEKGRTISVPAVSGLKRDLDGNVRIKNQRGAVRRLLNKAVREQIKSDRLDTQEDRAFRIGEREAALTEKLRPADEQIRIQQKRDELIRARESREIELQERKAEEEERQRKERLAAVKEAREIRLNKKFEETFNNFKKQLDYRTKKDIEKIGIRNVNDLANINKRHKLRQEDIKERLEFQTDKLKRRMLEIELKKSRKDSEDIYELRESVLRDQIKSTLREIDNAVGDTEEMLKTSLSRLQRDLYALSIERIEDIEDSAAKRTGTRTEQVEYTNPNTPPPGTTIRQ